MPGREIDNFLTRYLEQDRSPSVQYLIFDKDKIIHSFQKGFADILNKKQCTPATTFNAYSVTKTFTALAILQLAERNKIDIEQPVKNYLSDFPYSQQITIKQLLTHSAGIPNPIPLSWIHLSTEHSNFNRNNFFKSVFLKHPKATSAPNEKFAYSNLGYVLLGQLIEKVSGASYEKYIIENIIKPANIDPHELNFTIPDTFRHAKGYHKIFSLSYFILGFLINKKKYLDKKEGRWKSFKSNYVNGTAYGGLIGTPNAFMKYIQALLRSGNGLIPEEYKKILFTENITNTGKATSMCVSWFKGRLNDNEYFTHAGGGGGYYCEIRIYPGRGTGSVIMFNRTGMSDERILDKLDKYIIQ